MKQLEVLLFGVCLAITLGLYCYTNSVGETFAKAQFARLSEDSVKSLKARMITYLQSLNGAASLLRSSELVTRDDFSAYVSSLEIEKYLPGINGIGFIVPISAGGEPEFYEALRRIGEDRLTIKPQTDGPERLVITRIAPFVPNVEALGLDITFEQGRREAAQYARESGNPQLTPRILLVQDQTRQPGFLLLMPMYQQRYRPASDTLFRGEFIGWVYAPFVGQNLLRDLVPEQGISHHIAVFDGPGANDDRIIYNSADGPANLGSFATEQVVPLFGRTWTVQYKSTDAFDQRFNNFVPNGILAVGLALTFMLAFTMRNLRKRGEALSALADLRNRQAKARYQENRAIVENAIIPVFVLTDASEIVFANQAAQACFGFIETELNGMQFTQLVREISDPSVSANATGTKKSGHQLFLDVQRNQWVDSEGKQRVTAMVRDLSAEIEAIKELKQNKVRYDLALSGSRIGVFEVDLTAEQSEVSDTWREIMGYGRDEILDDTQQLLFGRIHPDDLHFLRDADTACKEGRNTRSVSEFRVAFPNNTWRWMRSDAVVVERDDDGKPLRLIGTQTDVTELRWASNALAQSEQSLQKIISTAPIGMALMAPKGGFIRVNEAFSKLCGQKSNYLLDAGRLSEIMPKEDFQDLHDALMLQAGEDPNGIYRGEHRILHSSGAVRWGLFNVSWTFDHGRKQTQFILQINDITAQKEIDQVKTEFVSTVSHELRTPLTSIKGALGLIHASDGPKPSKATLRLIEIARSNTDRLALIVNDILDLEKIAAGKDGFDFSRIDMGEAVRTTVQEMSPFAQTHGNQLRLVISSDPLWVNADESRTKQVCANLISNACKYSDTGTEIVIEVARMGEMIQTSVENIGDAIPALFKPKMFEAFSQADASDTRAKGGTGLGLNISRQIVTRHQGRIGYHSEIDEPTVFWFAYPACAAKSAGPVSSPLQVGDPKRGPKRQVLHLEDDDDFAEIIKSELAPVADVALAHSLAEARVLFNRRGASYDVVLIDWTLLDGDADALLDEIFTAHPDVRAIGLSADAGRTKDDRVEAYLIKTRTELPDLSRLVMNKPPSTERS